MNALGLAELPELALLPNRMALHLVDRWRHASNIEQNLRSLVCCHTGWHSTWSTAGGTRATASRSSSFLLEKLLTPMARALPESWSFSIAAHVAGISVGRTFCPPKPAPFFILTGQWILRTA
uniref:Uncharacterized protein n=1 Tax=Oryza glumipatula TaxID=40148 RepID=A0A0E0A064_9ORYZ